MAKLSALTNTSMVKINIAGAPITCNWLEYNHYGASEVALFVPSIDIFAPIGGTKPNPGGGKSYIDTTPYFNSPMDQILNTIFPLYLDENVKASLKKVSIGDGYSTLQRSCFRPSPTEAGCKIMTGWWTYPTVGKSFSTLKTVMHNADSEYSQLRGKINLTVPGSGSFESVTGTSGMPTFLGYSNYTKFVSGTSYAPIWYIEPEYSLINRHYYGWACGTVCPLFTPMASGNSNGYMPFFGGTSAYFPAGSSHYTISDRDDPVGKFLITLDGNCEVTGSGTSYTLSKPAAVESYRKINGVWYRTI